MRPVALRRWLWVHRWSSLVCTAFLLMLCLTGLPLIFHDEIDAALNPDAWRPANPDGALLDLDMILRIALERRPGDVPVFMSFDVDRPVVNVTTGASPADAGALHFASFDRTSGALVPPADVGEGVMHFLLQLHTDMFLGLPGMLFLATMGFLFAVAIVSGIPIYGPFIGTRDFGAIRSANSARTAWLDRHNFLGAVAVAWTLVVGLTGVVNALERPVIGYWRETALADLVEGAGGGAPGAGASLDAAVTAAVAAAPDMALQFVAFPGSAYSTEAHYAIFLHGRTPLTEHVIAPVLIHAASGRVEGLRDMPWYMKALALSRPLHFGDYGGLPLKIVWALLNLATIVILGSGLYIWVAKRGRRVDREPRAKAT
ncbi:PepSY-associated TM helix domain-containing protein [Rubrimonas cliftonensis]|uniref:Uncharacterized iron-regulated membrane protein n=1 Tax=Rubrimonas cliftonensis TaxID=89524 RepID=A0A1H4F2E9_9RHOB|nr:PepSY domain-containing protein [Rubrimonas cliftonensis]SEA90652.1 Uncharacterized iron-regulated membrane protein [Rubrimonas cliftonensis]